MKRGKAKNHKISNCSMMKNGWFCRKAQSKSRTSGCLKISFYLSKTSKLTIFFFLFFFGVIPLNNLRNLSELSYKNVILAFGNF